MAIEFTIAPLVVSGSYIYAADAAKQAEAINTRLISGMADCTKRIHQYVQHAARQIRLPVDASTWPSSMEYQALYQQLQYENDAASWPDAEAGDAEGINLATPIGGFVFGRGDTIGEGNHLSQYDIFPRGENTPLQFWELAKRQRGLYDINSGNINAPMWYELNQNHFRFSYTPRLRHGNSPGGYLPTIEQLPNPCSDTDDNGSPFYWPNLNYKFEILATGEIFSFGGSCGPDFGGSDTDIKYIVEYPQQWFILLYNGESFTYLKSLYRLVQDGGGVLAREEGDQLNRLFVNQYLSGFRGTELQRKTTCFNSPIIEHAFAFEEFFRSQYQLAPAAATVIGQELDSTIGYPAWTFLSGSMVSASISTTTAVNSGFRVGGQLILQSKLTNDVTVQLWNGSTVIGTYTISPSSGSHIDIFENGPTTGNVFYKFATTPTYSGADGYIYIEQSQLYDVKPQHWDAYTYIRMSSARGALAEDTMDDRGRDADYAKTISDNYFRYGCMINVHGAVGVNQNAAAINTNPVIDAGREYLDSFTKTIHGYDVGVPTRPLLVGYEVSASVSVLTFQKEQFAGSTQLFSNLLNPNNSASNGIVHTAATQSWTNEWVMEMCGKPYHSSESSIWKKSQYADYYSLINRCHLYPPTFELDKDNNRDLFQFIQDLPPNPDLRARCYIPESVSAYNYDGGAIGRARPLNQPQDGADENNTKQFYLSCQIYPKPYLITEIREIAGDKVRIALDKRLQYSGSVVTTLSGDISGWDFNVVKAEGYRTDENIVRLFLLKAHNDGNNPSATIGDQSMNSTLQLNADNPYASIIPTFFFTKLVPKPYTGGLLTTSVSSLNSSGSIPLAYPLQLIETYLRAICEGFVDETLSTTQACESNFSTDYDYTYANLCDDAFGLNYPTMLTGSVRPDNPIAYGPLPNLILNNQRFNQLSQMINKLTKVRLPLPYKVQFRRKQYEDIVTISPDWPVGAQCSEANSRMIRYDYSLPTPTTLIETSDWQDAFGGITAYWRPIVNSCGVSNTFIILNNREVFDLRFDAVDPLAWLAMDPDLRDIASGSANAAIFTRDQDTVQTYTITSQPTPGISCNGSEQHWRDDITGLYYVYTLNQSEPPATCTYHEGDLTISPPAMVESDIMIGAKITNNTPGGQGWCNALPETSKTITVKNTRHMIVVVPTVP